MLIEPQRTAYDVHFRLLGIPVRVSPFFWLVAFILGFNLVREDPRLIVIWIAAVFVSILVHEFGHALTFRRFRIPSYVVLYHFGGLAVPQTRDDDYRPGPYLSPRQHILVSAAGPAAGLLLAVLVIAATLSMGARVEIPLPGVGNLVLGADLPYPANPFVDVLVFSLVYINIVWSLLNLLPVYPLDGGQISRELFTLSRSQHGLRNSLVLSVAAAGAVALLGFLNHQVFLAIMFALLAFSSYQALQVLRDRGPYGGSGGGDSW